MVSLLVFFVFYSSFANILVLERTLRSTVKNCADTRIGFPNLSEYTTHNFAPTFVLHCCPVFSPGAVVSTAWTTSVANWSAIRRYGLYQHRRCHHWRTKKRARYVFTSSLNGDDRMCLMNIIIAALLPTLLKWTALNTRLTQLIVDDAAKTK